MKEEGQSRKRRVQLRTKFLDVLLSGSMMLLIECDQNLAVRTADCRTVTKCIVKRLGAQANVIDDEIKFIAGNRLADLILDLTEQQLRRLDASSWQCSYMETDLTRVDGWEKIFADKR